MSIKLQIIIVHIAVEVYGFKSFAKLLRLGYIFSKKDSFESFKKRYWTRNFDHCGPRLIFFLAKVSKYKASRLSFNKIRPRVIHSFNNNSYSFLQSNQTTEYKSISTKLFQGIMNPVTFDLSITALVLILDISSLTRLPRESSCHANQWTDHTRLFWGPAVA